MITKEKKKEIVKTLSEKISRGKAIVFINYTGLTVNQMQELRERLRDKEIDCRVAKKTLIDLALEKAGFKDLKVRNLTGQLALVFDYQDEVTPAKILYNFSKENEKVKLVAGLIDGEYLSAEEVVHLAQLPSREELIAKLLGNLAAPLSGLVNVLEDNLRKLVFVLKKSGARSVKPCNLGKMRYNKKGF